MALSRQDVILSCIAVFISWTIVSTLIPSLSLVPYAFLAGLFTAAGLFVFVVASTSRGARHAVRIPTARSTFLSFTSPEAWAAETASLKDRSSYDPQSVYGASQTISSRIDGVLNLILRDFLNTWYSKLSNGGSFSIEVDRAIRNAVNSLIEKIVVQDLVEIGVTRIVPIIDAHIKDFAEAERLVRGRNLTSDVTETEELELAIATKYREGRVHPAVSLAATRTAATQQQHMRRVIGRLITEILPESMTTSASVLVLVREILACAVLVPVLQMISEPDMLNQLIEGYGRSVLYERKNVRKLRAALDKHTTPVKGAGKVLGIPHLSSDDSERAFERFVRAIRQLNSLTDARRCRSEILRQLTRDAAQQSDDAVYLRRLEIGKKLVEQRIGELLRSHPSQSGSFTDQSKASVNGFPKRENASLKAILYDASGLSYFMEYMDRLRVMSLVQFWIVVDGMRNPLDPDIDGAEQSRSWNSADRSDIVMISEAYIGKIELQIPKSSQKTIKDFIVAGSRASWKQYVAARKAILTAQDETYREMESHHFPGFKQSDLFYKWLTSDASDQAGRISFNSNEQEHHGRPALAAESRKSSEWARPLVGTQTRQNSDLARPGLVRPTSGLKMRKSSELLSTPKLKEGDLRRAVASSSDLRRTAQDIERATEGRRSFDDSRPSLFGDDDDDTDPLARSTQSLDLEKDPANQSEQDRTRIVAAVQAALDNIVDEGADREELFSSRDPLTPLEMESPPTPFAITHPGDVPAESPQDRPSLASLGLIGGPTRPTVFTKGDLFGEGEKMWKDEGDTTDDSQAEDDDDVREAAPGDLGLAELVQSLSVEIDKLEAQQGVLDTLTRKAELTNNAAELRILRKSKLSLEREIHRKELQRQQYIVQQSENDLYGRAIISIKRIIIGTEEDGHEFALYVIEVQRHTTEKAPAVSWAVAKRYSEFHDLHKRLRTRYPSVKELDFPRRQIVLTLQKEFLKKRRASLERYLRELLTKPDVCRSLEFRAFLSQQAIRPITSNGETGKVDRQDFITRIYNSVTDGMEEFLGNMPVLDQLSLAGQSLISAATSLPSPPTTLLSQPTTASLALPGSIANDPATAAEAEAEMSALESYRYPETTTFIKPICDLFIDLFQLHQGNAWLRGRAVVVVLQQLLGGTIERRVREAFRSATTEQSVAHYIDLLRDTLWPDGRFRGPPAVRTPALKARSKREAGLVLAALLPDFAGGVVGKSSAAKAGRTLFATLNNERLNQQLVYSIVDEIIEAVFGGAVRSMK